MSKIKKVNVSLVGQSSSYEVVYHSGCVRYFGVEVPEIRKKLPKTILDFCEHHAFTYDIDTGYSKPVYYIVFQ